MTNRKRKLYLLFKNGDFSIAILFYWEGILKIFHHPTHFGSFQSVNLTLVIFVQGTIFLFDQKSTFPSQLGLEGSVVVTAATGQPYPEVPGDGARMGCMIIKDVAPKQNNRNHNMPPLKIMDSKVRKRIC